MTQISSLNLGDGCPLAYRWDGEDGPPVLVLSNSIATDHRMWDGIVGELSRSFRVLRYDTRGHGQSGAPAGAYSLDRLGRDVLELADALGVGRFHFCGLSLGGMVGQWLGVHAPERIDRLILSNTAANLDPPGQWDSLISDLAARRDMAAIADMFIGNWFPPALLDAQPATITAFRETILATSPEGLSGCFAAVRDMDMRRTNALITSPTLVVGGQHDTVTSPRHSEEITAAVPGAELLMLPGVHMLNVELPTDFLDAVTGFLGSGRLP